ncbi:MAG: Ankyrin [Pseudonocardiales bacterium]|nr:Ankyrin [Pseudonocardiales bacterium]
MTGAEIPATAADAVESFFEAIAEGNTASVRGFLDDEPTLLAAVSPEGVRAPLAALYAGHAPLADELAGRSDPLDVHESAAFDDNGRLRTLLRENPGAVAAWSLDGWQPLHLAAYFGRTEAVRHLLDEDAPPDEPSRNSLRVTPLQAAASASHSEIVWLLIAEGASVDSRQRGGSTALHLAAAAGDVDSVQALLSGGASKNAENDAGHRPVDVATDAVKGLLQ